MTATAWLLALLAALAGVGSFLVWVDGRLPPRDIDAPVHVAQHSLEDARSETQRLRKPPPVDK